MKLPAKEIIVSIVLFFFLSADLYSQNNKPSAPTTFFVLFHTPGKNWVASLPFKEQPNVMEHVKYMSTFLESKKLIMGGPFLDNSGGMMIYSCEKIEEALKIANDDPCVKNGLLNVEVKQWFVPMKTIEQKN
ncbi:YciI family protein [Flavobacterium sp.]|uniref:YciI family protein n=1 Tax=Flavobacterium sp. TaxID=239 RepID=UPI003527B372